MNDPWQILILDANTATEKDVKAAYARLLKQHRPDADPEGFRRVREAYEFALALVRERGAQGAPLPAPPHRGDEGGNDSPSARDEAPCFAPVPDELPASVRSSFEAVERALAARHAHLIGAALQTFHEQCEAARVDAEVRVRAIERACGENIKLLASAISDPILLRFAELGQVGLPHAVLSSWSEDEQRERIGQLGQAMLDEPHRLATPDGSLLVARVGVLVGLEMPALAASLGNQAFPHLPVNARNEIMARLEHETAIGHVFASVSAEMRPFWFERLRHAGEAHDWKDTASLRALDQLVERNRYMWQGWGIIQQLLPEERWQQVESRLRLQAQQVAQQSAPRASKFPSWLLFPIIIIGINLLRFLASESSSSSHGSRSRDIFDRREPPRRVEPWQQLVPSLPPVQPAKPGVPSVLNLPSNPPSPSSALGTTAAPMPRLLQPSGRSSNLNTVPFPGTSGSLNQQKPVDPSLQGLQNMFDDAVRKQSGPR